MYTYEEREKAVKLYIKYGLSAAATVRELGYPEKKTLTLWYKEYKETGELHKEFIKHPNYSREKIEKAVNHYLNHGRCISRTCKILGYPSRPTLRGWIEELAPGQKKVGNSGGRVVEYTEEQKKAAVIEFCARKGSAESVAKAHGTSRRSLYNWKNDLLGGEKTEYMKRLEISSLPDDKTALEEILTDLKDQVYHQKMELDILTKAAEILKKDQGIDQRNLTNKEKHILIDALRKIYPLNHLLTLMDMPRSSYYYQRTAHGKPDKYSDIRKTVESIFIESNKRYGYRRIHAVIKNSGTIISEKVVRKIMTEEQLIVPGKKKRKYNSYMGDISPAVENVIERDFHTDKPNDKWVTDLSEFHIPAGKVFLSPIVDCFDGLAVSWAIGTSPNAELVNDMLDSAINTLKDEEKPIVHSDRAGHYRWPGWILRMEKAGLIRSMSKKACPPDNAACEGFFGTIKNEMFYHRSWADYSIAQFIEELDLYLRWYNEKRIKISLGAMSPLEYRQSIGLGR
jgi:transposase InsO family protein/transposase-like protein